MNLNWNSFVVQRYQVISSAAGMSILRAGPTESYIQHRPRLPVYQVVLINAHFRILSVLHPASC